MLVRKDSLISSPTGCHPKSRCGCRSPAQDTRGIDRIRASHAYKHALFLHTCLVIAGPKSSGADGLSSTPTHVTPARIHVSCLQQSRFQSMSQNIIKRIDDMGSRIDELETSIADLMQQASAGYDGLIVDFACVNASKLCRLHQQTMAKSDIPQLRTEQLLSKSFFVCPAWQ